MPDRPWHDADADARDEELPVLALPDPDPDPETETFPDLHRLLEQLALARSIAPEAHAGQVDENGDPYLHHPARVAARVATLRGQAVSWLHDVLEDTDVDAAQLLEAGLDLEVVNAVLALTRREGVPDSAYSGQVRADGIALEVKLADIADDLDPAHGVLRPEVRERLAQKYDRARRALGAEEARPGAPRSTIAPPERCWAWPRATRSAPGYEFGPPLPDDTEVTMKCGPTPSSVPMTRWRAPSTARSDAAAHRCCEARTPTLNVEPGARSSSRHQHVD